MCAVKQAIGLCDSVESRSIRRGCSKLRAAASDVPLGISCVEDSYCAIVTLICDRRSDETDGLAAADFVSEFRSSEVDEGIPESVGWCNRGLVLSPLPSDDPSGDTIMNKWNPAEGYAFGYTKARAQPAEGGSACILAGF
jgi:hypothetical protein